MKKFILRSTLTIILIAFISTNLLAYIHASSMMVYAPAGETTKAGKKYGFWKTVRIILTGANVPRPVNKKTPSDFNLDYQKHNYPGYNNTMLEAWDIPGENREIVFIIFHGHGASKSSLLKISAQLNKMGVSAFLVDFYGSGGSSGSENSIGYHEAADVTASFNYVRKLKPNSRIVLYGISMGSAAVMRSIAIDKIKPDAVILEATFGSLLTTLKNRFEINGLPSTPLAHMMVFWGGWKIGADAFSHNPVEYAKSITSPTLILHGGKDTRARPAQALAIYNNVKGKKLLSIYRDTAHMQLIKSDISRWQQDIKKVLSMLNIP